MGKFRSSWNMFSAENETVNKNTFLTMEAQNEKLPTYEEAKHKLPRPIWDTHPEMIKCYDKAWKLAFGNLRAANDEARFVSNFIDTAFNGYLFMWDSSFILMFGKYGSRAFNFQRTLDNFYSHQHIDGFICREIDERDGSEQFSRDDPASTGPNVMPWAEWEYFKSTNDTERLSRVFDPLCAYHKWLQLNRSWPDGSYWSCGLACGMDNQPRQQPGYHELVSHGFMSWIDACAQQYLSAEILIEMAKILGREDEAEWLRDEHKMLADTINNKMWSEDDAFYYDTLRDGKTTGVKSVGAYWTLLAGLVPEERRERFIAHLDNEKEFKRPTRVPALSADAVGYKGETGGYWKGGVWAPTNYMVLSGLGKYGYNKLAYEIACDYLNTVEKVFTETDTLWENYSPEFAAHGNAKDDFVGWTGLAPISILFEYVFGIIPDAMGKKITWNINCTDRHGITNYPLGDATVELICESRSSADEKPVVHIKSDRPITVEIVWNGTHETINV